MAILNQETPLQQARRRVAGGEACGAQQELIIGRLLVYSANAQTLGNALVALDAMRRTLAIARDHLEDEERKRDRRQTRIAGNHG